MPKKLSIRFDTSLKRGGTVPFEIVRNNIVNMQVDAIVNPASRGIRVNPGVDMAIHKKAGPQLFEARRSIGPIGIGDAALTPGFGLDARYVIHAPSPIWVDGTKGEEQLLLKTYDRCLRLAVANECESVAFPLLASGNHGYPKQKAIQIAVRAFSDFLMEHDLHIYLVVFGKESFALSEKLVQNVASFIDEHYVDAYEREYPVDRRRRMRQECCLEACVEDKDDLIVSCPSSSGFEEIRDLDRFLKQKDAGFAVTLVDLIERSGKKNSEVYKKANVDKKLFSKIINNVNYHPSKQTAVAFAIALELDLAQTQDLIGRAGYKLTHSSKFDLIIEFFILKKQYDIFEINEVLFEFDEVLLGY